MGGGLRSTALLLLYLSFSQFSCLLCILRFPNPFSCRVRVSFVLFAASPCSSAHIRAAASLHLRRVLGEAVVPHRPRHRTRRRRPPHRRVRRRRRRRRRLRLVHPAEPRRPRRIPRRHLHPRRPARRREAASAAREQRAPRQLQQRRGSLTPACAAEEVAESAAVRVGVRAARGGLACVPGLHQRRRCVAARGAAGLSAGTPAALRTAQTLLPAGLVAQALQPEEGCVLVYTAPLVLAAPLRVRDVLHNGVAQQRVLLERILVRKLLLRRRRTRRRRRQRRLRRRRRRLRRVVLARQLELRHGCRSRRGAVVVRRRRCTPACVSPDEHRGRRRLPARRSCRRRHRRLREQDGRGRGGHRRGRGGAEGEGRRCAGRLAGGRPLGAEAEGRGAGGGTRPVRGGRRLGALRGRSGARGGCARGRGGPACGLLRRGRRCGGTADPLGCEHEGVRRGRRTVRRVEEVLLDDGR
eukprot:Rhum_TRINITY_DN14955_c5_g3::Rhum_TRINITY_DN14955_c5_g3_i1::g.130055::m.130055